MSQTSVIVEARQICASSPGIGEGAQKQLLEGRLDRTPQVVAVVEGLLRGHDLAIHGVRLV